MTMKSSTGVWVKKLLPKIMPCSYIKYAPRKFLPFYNKAFDCENNRKFLSFCKSLYCHLLKTCWHWQHMTTVLALTTYNNNVHHLYDNQLIITCTKIAISDKYQKCMITEKFHKYLGTFTMFVDLSDKLISSKSSYIGEWVWEERILFGAGMWSWEKMIKISRFCML